MRMTPNEQLLQHAEAMAVFAEDLATWASSPYGEALHRCPGLIFLEHQGREVQLAVSQNHNDIFHVPREFAKTGVVFRRRRCGQHYHWVAKCGGVNLVVLQAEEIPLADDGSEVQIPLDLRDLLPEGGAE